MQAQGQSVLGEGHHLDALVAAMGPGDYMPSAARASFLTLATQVMRPPPLPAFVAAVHRITEPVLSRATLSASSHEYPVLPYVALCRASMPRGFSPC
jgi:hypothetical protein